MPLFETITDLQEGAEVLQRRRYGVIEMLDDQLVGVHLRPWPKLVSLPEVWFLGNRYHRLKRGNRCWLYYNQPLGHSAFLTITYGVSRRDTSLRAVRGALRVLDEIARIKDSNAILCEVSNARISDRLLARWGWQSHVEGSWRRHFIKRFYGEFPLSRLET